MSVELLERLQPTLPNAEFLRETSFGAAVYGGIIDHGNGRDSYFIETVPSEPLYPDTAFLVCGGYTSEVSPTTNDYKIVQRQFAVQGERSIGVGHTHHANYEIGDNVDDIVQTYNAAVAAGIGKIILVGHSMGCPEVLRAYKKILNCTNEPTKVTDIVLVDPACFAEQSNEDLAKSLPLFVVESLAGFIKNPLDSTMRRLNVVKNVFKNKDKYSKELHFLRSNHDGPAVVAAIAESDKSVRFHLILGI